MLRLITVEARRTLARRLTWVSLLLVLAVAALTFFGARESAKWETEARLRENLATQASGQSLESWQTTMDECTASKKAGDGMWAGSDSCAEMVGPKPTPEGAQEAFERELPRLRERQRTFLATMLSSTALPLMLIPLLIGATGVGSEYSSGALGQWLTFVPRRLRVYASRLLGPVVAMAVPFALGIGLVLLTATIGVEQAGGSDVLDRTAWTPLAGVGLRIWLAMLAVLAGASALGFILRSTVGVITAVLGWLIVVEGFLFQMSGRDLGQSSLVNHMMAWLAGEHRWQFYPRDCMDSACAPVAHLIAWPVAGWHLAAVLAAIMAVGAALFARRDVS